MLEHEFRQWLRRTGSRRFAGRPLSPSSIRQYVTDAQRVQQLCGNLDALYVRDRFARFFHDPQKSMPLVPSVGGYVTAMKYYRDFLDHRMRERLR